MAVFVSMSSTTDIAHGKKHRKAYAILQHVSLFHPS